MIMNMFKATTAKTIDSYLAKVPKERQRLILFLHKFIKKSVPKLKSHFAYNMLGYGSFPYRNYKNQHIQWPIIALANQKNYVSIYICAVEKGKYIAEKYKQDLGKVSVGKSCVRFKKLDDLNLPALKKLLLLAEKHPGLTAKTKYN
jgi:hypothetical protein